jgi:hypothetical protein
MHAPVERRRILWSHPNPVKGKKLPFSAFLWELSNAQKKAEKLCFHGIQSINLLVRAVFPPSRVFT